MVFFVNRCRKSGHILPACLFFTYQKIVAPNTYREITSINVRMILGMVMALMTFTDWFSDFWLLKAV